MSAINHKSFNPDHILKMVKAVFEKHGDLLETVCTDYKIVTLNTPYGKCDQLVPLIVFKCKKW